MGSKTFLTAAKRHFRVTPRNRHHQVGPVGPVRATSGHGNEQLRVHYARGICGLRLPFAELSGYKKSINWRSRCLGGAIG
jgi:hypothetical protein